MNKQRSFLLCIIAFAACFLGAKPIIAANSVVASFTNDYAILEFDDHGLVHRLADRATGQNRVQAFQANFVTGTNGVKNYANHMAMKDGRLAFSMPDWDGALEMSVRVEKWGFVFTIEACTLQSKVPIKDLTVLRIWPNGEFRGGYGHVLGGATSANHTIALRAYDLDTVVLPMGGALLSASVREGANPVGRRFALTFAPCGDETVACLKAMTLDSGCFHTKCGGAWSLESPENRRSYLFASFACDTIDDWIDLAERGGFATLHASGWWKALGHYEPNRAKFPRGEVDLKACIDRARVAGLTVSTHTLCSGISFSDPWITPLCNTNVLALYTYTLAAPLAADAQELVVNEKPGPRHDLVTAYFSNGNILRIGTELMTYTGITQTPPYRFTGLKRGAYGTRKIGAIAAGTPVDYVFQHFMTLFPDPKTPFGIEMAKYLCDFCNRMGFVLVYQDGAEPFSRYDVALNRLNFTKYLDQTRCPVQIEASTWNTESWWFHSRIGATDHPVWAMKRFHDNHIKGIRTARRVNYMSGQMGWWNPRLACDYAEGHYIDDMEYFAAKNAAFDFPMSIQGVSASAGPLPLSHERQMTLLGWYERARLARAFTPEAQALMTCDRGETRLRQDDSGRWMMSAVTAMTHRVASADFRSWKMPMSRAASSTVRVKALYGAEHYVCSNAVNLVGADDLPAFAVESSKTVTRTLSVGDDPVHGRTLQIVAENSARSRMDAWVKAELSYTHPFRDIRVRNSVGGSAFGFWIKGDGSGAVLNLQLASSRLFVGGLSDHIVKIDFTGWRYVQLFVRERDAEERHNHVWPQQPHMYALYRNALNLERIDAIRLFLIEVPGKGRTAIELSQVKVLPTKPLTLCNAAFTVGNSRYAVPFALSSGDFAELEGGVWTRYSVRGEALEAAPAAGPVVFAAGENACSFDAQCADCDPRAELMFFAQGESVPAFVAKPQDAEHMAYEAVSPIPYDPSKGFSKLPPVRTRPGEDARLEFTVYGAVRNPAVQVGGEKVVFPVDVAADAKLVMKDGVNWRVMNYKRKVLKTGVLERPLPMLRSGEAAIFSADAGTNARFSVVKRYGASVSRTMNSETLTTAGETKVPWRGCAVAMSPEVMWARGGFGDAMAFDGRKAAGTVTPATKAADGWTVTAWVRAGAENKAKAAWTLTGEIAAGRDLQSEKWTFVAVRGVGTAPSFRLGTDGSTLFEGIVDDLEVHAGQLSDARISELTSDADHIDVIGYQDDGTGGVQQIKLVPRD